MCVLIIWAAEGWPDDDVDSRAWNYSCCSYLGHFPSCSGMTNLYNFPTQIKPDYRLVLWPFLAFVLLLVLILLLLQNPSKMKKAQAEIDAVLGKGRISFDSLKKLEYVLLLKLPFNVLVNL